MKERPILFSKITGKPSNKGKKEDRPEGVSWRRQHKDEVNARRRELYATDKDKHRKRAGVYRKRNVEKVRQVNAVWLYGYRRRVRSEMIAAYGSKCTCCGEREFAFLQLDHINNDGAAERRKENANGVAFFARLKNRGWPNDRYQLLCANCNFGKRMNGGICPHKNQY